MEQMSDDGNMTFPLAVVPVPYSPKALDSVQVSKHSELLSLLFELIVTIAVDRFICARARLHTGCCTVLSAYSATATDQPTQLKF